jgi:hypothetical protein
MFGWDPNRRLILAINNLCKEIEKMAINTAALTQAVVDLKAAAGVASAALDDLAAKLAAIPPQDPAVQAAIDDAVAQISTIKDGLNATAAKDDPAPPAA